MFSYTSACITPMGYNIDDDILDDHAARKEDQA